MDPVVNLWIGVALAVAAIAVTVVAWNRRYSARIPITVAAVLVGGWGLVWVVSGLVWLAEQG